MSAVVLATCVCVEWVVWCVAVVCDEALRRVRSCVGECRGCEGCGVIEKSLDCGLGTSTTWVCIVCVWRARVVCVFGAGVWCVCHSCDSAMR